jgi:hypothetical protein
MLTWPVSMVGEAAAPGPPVLEAPQQLLRHRPHLRRQVLGARPRLRPLVRVAVALRHPAPDPLLALDHHEVGIVQQAQVVRRVRVRDPQLPRHLRRAHRAAREERQHPQPHRVRRRPQ